MRSSSGLTSTSLQGASRSSPECFPCKSFQSFLLKARPHAAPLLPARRLESARRDMGPGERVSSDTFVVGGSHALLTCFAPTLTSSPIRQPTPSPSPSSHPEYLPCVPQASTGAWTSTRTGTAPARTTVSQSPLSLRRALRATSKRNMRSPSSTRRAPSPSLCCPRTDLTRGHPPPSRRHAQHTSCFR